MLCGNRYCVPTNQQSLCALVQAVAAAAALSQVPPAAAASAALPALVQVCMPIQRIVAYRVQLPDDRGVKMFSVWQVLMITARPAAASMHPIC